MGDGAKIDTWPVRDEANPEIPTPAKKAPWQQPTPNDEEARYWKKLRREIAHSRPARGPKDHLQALEEAIAGAFNDPDPLTAVHGLEGLLRKTDDAFAFGLAHMRRALNKVEPPDCVAPPLWLEEARDRYLSVHNDGPAIQSAVRLCQALLARTNPSLRASISQSPLGAVVVEWHTPCGLEWHVSTPRLRWPGVEVRGYWSEDGSAAPLARSFFYAGSAVEHALQKNVAK